MCIMYTVHISSCSRMAQYLLGASLEAAKSHLVYGYQYADPTGHLGVSLLSQIWICFLNFVWVSPGLSSKKAMRSSGPQKVAWLAHDLHMTSTPSTWTKTAKGALIQNSTKFLRTSISFSVPGLAGKRGSAPWPQRRRGTHSRLSQGNKKMTVRLT